jgi:predicted metal-dependent phosphoesterase TrpH
MGGVMAAAGGGTAGKDRHELSPGRHVVPSAPSTIDLHSHTLRSDGLLTPIELATQAAAVGVRLLSITDHDTLAGVRELARLPLPPGLEILPGVELNAIAGARADLRDEELHILGLGVDPDDERLEATLAKQRSSRRTRFDEMVARCRAIGLPIESALEQLPTTDDDDALGRPRVARAMIANGYVESVEDAFQRYLSRGKPAYVPREGLDPFQAIQATIDAHGVPVLAHFREAPSHLPLLRELMDTGLRGIEVYYRTYDQDTVELLKSIAGRLGLIAAGGSDYHGDRETYAEAHADLWVPPVVEPPLRAAIAQAAGIAA